MPTSYQALPFESAHAAGQVVVQHPERRVSVTVGLMQPPPDPELATGTSTVTVTSTWAPMATELPFTSAPINFDLVVGKIVPTGGDVRITVNRPADEVSEHNPQDWGFEIEAVDGGLIEASDAEASITYSAPANGYQSSDTITASSNRHGIGVIQQVFFIQSRNGQVYSKLGISFRINNVPSGTMYVTFGGVANTNGSRNWEGDGNTMNAIGQ